MLLKEFYTSVILNEVVCVNFLQRSALLGEPDQQDPCHKCGTLMVEKRRRTRVGEGVPIPSFKVILIIDHYCWQMK